jgi:hypothetical protein
MTACRLADSAQSFASLADEECIIADPRLCEVFDVGVTHLALVEEVGKQLLGMLWYLISGAVLRAWRAPRGSRY